MPRPGERTKKSSFKANTYLFPIFFSLLFALQILVIVELKAHNEVDSAAAFATPVVDKRTWSDQSNHGTQTLKQKGKSMPTASPDGTFNGYSVYHQTYKDGFHSNAHCIGENFKDDAWFYRSCYFQNLCFDTKERRFVLFTSKEQQDLERALEHSELTHFSPASSMNTTLSLGAMNQKWGDERNQLEWYPELRSADDIMTSGYYTLQTDKVLIPYHSMAGFNPGHLVWDDFLPLYTLLTAFDLAEKDMVLIRYDLKLAQWASCQRQWDKCKPILKKFYPLIGVHFDKTSNQNETSLEISGIQKSNYVCAPNGAAGLGMLSDHGLKLHGWKPKDYEYTFNIGRGGSLYRFRNWMMKNTGVSHDRKIHSAPYRIVVSQGSSDKAPRMASFKTHIELLKEKLGNKYELDIQVVTLSKMTLKDQLELVAGASIFITMCGGGAVTGMFLPKGASIFAFFNEMDGTGDTPARLDWDLLNNLGHLRVHWLPRPRPKDEVTRKAKYPVTKEYDYDAFVRLVDHELDVISHTNDY